MQAIKLLTTLCLVGACGTSDGGDAPGGGSNDLVFHGEQKVLPDFNFDTGLQPAASPVQLQIKLSAGGGLTADALGKAGGKGDALAVAGTPGSGLFKLDAHVKLEGLLHVDAAGGTLKYDGPIPGIENIDVAFGGETMFDPFLMAGASAKVSAAIPEIKLPPIPLPAGLPGNLQITIAEGSVITTELFGTCAGFDAHSAMFKAKTATGGSLVLKSEIVLKLPVVGDKTFPIPSVTVPIPAFEAAMDMGQVEFPGGGAVPEGSMLTPKDACGPGGEPIPGVCTPQLKQSYAPVWHPANGAHANLCTPTQLQTFDDACLSSFATVDSCHTFRHNNPTCGDCLISDWDSPGYGPLIVYQNMVSYNVAGCVTIKDPSKLACAKKIEAYTDCLDTACSTCTGEDKELTNSCLSSADTKACHSYATDYETCVTAIESGPAASCLTGTPDYALFCGQ